MMEFMDDALFLSEIRKDNEAAFAFLFKKSFPRLLGYDVRFVENAIVRICCLYYVKYESVVVKHRIV